MISKLFFPFGHDLFGIYRKNLIYNIVGRNLKLKYRQSFLGMLWTLLIPAFSSAIYYFVFQFVMKVQIPNYLLFILSGMLPWTFLSVTIMNGTECIVQNGYLINKVPVPPSIFPLTETLTGFINFILAVPVLLIVAFMTSAPMTASLLLLPVYFALLLIQIYSVSLLMATLFVYFRDLRHLISLIMQVWFYLTPVVYTEAMVPEDFRWIFILNPVAYIFSAIHTIIIFGVTPPFPELGIAATWSLLLLIVSFWAYHKLSTFIAENI